MANLARFWFAVANLANLTPKLTLIECQVRRREPGLVLVRRGEPGEPDT